ncbi:hypothetical protein BRADI_1g00672v3 [Brachypodium distachyon]|uniref:Uncharacterized protein n=1 Tax=Brachypodium distachyon TaxID=15368 RepID=A0A2K2DHJ3_BRADI|nr:hypothetical protein BRADI_1g00672v3 [Brachypodium distachyon]
MSAHQHHMHYWSIAGSSASTACRWMDGWQPQCECCILFMQVGRILINSSSPGQEKEEWDLADFVRGTMNLKHRCLMPLN